MYGKLGESMENIIGYEVRGRLTGEDLQLSPAS